LLYSIFYHWATLDEGWLQTFIHSRGRPLVTQGAFGFFLVEMICSFSLLILILRLLPSLLASYIQQVWYCSGVYASPNLVARA